MSTVGGHQSEDSEQFSHHERSGCQPQQLHHHQFSSPYCISFEELPSEIFLHVCSFLEARFVIETLGQVCQLFHSIINTDTFWKVRIRKRWPKQYPPIPVNDECFDWQVACIAREEQHRLWSNPDEMMDYYSYSHGLYAPVDAVHLMKSGSLLAVGSRDRYLHILDLTKLRSGDPESVRDTSSVVKMNAHKGWIWTINSLDNMLATGSWDTHIKFWDLAADCTQVHDIKIRSAALCSHYEYGFYVSGSYDKKVYHMDPRCSTVIAEKKYHQKPILCLAANNNYIVTGSEDSTICIYDRRADSVLKKILFESYPMSLSYTDDQMWVGDKAGELHLVDATDGDFNVVETYDIGHKGQVTSVINTLGVTFTSSTDKTIKVLEPSVKPSVISTLSKQTAEVARIDYQNDVLAIANSSISVGIYKRKDHILNTF